MNAASNSQWKRIGWRSIRHLGAPHILIRFGTHTVRPKFIKEELEWRDQEKSSGRDPQVCIDRFIAQGCQFWEGIKEIEQQKGLKYGQV